MEGGGKGRGLGQCEEKCSSTQAMLVGKLWKSRKVMEREKRKEGSKK